MVERLDYKRAGLALIAVAALVMAMVAITAGTPAYADHAPDETYSSANDDQGENSNEGPFWDAYFGLPAGSCEKINESDGVAFEMPAPPPGEVWYALVVKQGSPQSNDGPDNFIWYNPEEGHSYPSAGNQAPGYSHIIVCSVDEPDETTTTTVPEETTTTAAEETTTTVAEETTTTVEILETTLTTAPAETTSSSVADTVLGTEVLPFTGVESEWTFWLATILALTGGLLVFGAKRAED